MINVDKRDIRAMTYCLGKKPIKLETYDSRSLVKMSLGSRYCNHLSILLGSFDKT